MPGALSWPWTIGSDHRHWETAVVELADIIGSGLHVSEAVPAALWRAISRVRILP